MNKQGFTLIELLGVLVVLTLIGLIAIPSIASTIERNKNKIKIIKGKITPKRSPTCCKYAEEALLATVGHAKIIF